MDPNVVCSPVAVRWATAAQMLDCHPNKVRLLAKAGLLDTILVGVDRGVTYESIKRFVRGGGEVKRAVTAAQARRLKGQPALAQLVAEAA